MFFRGYIKIDGKKSADRFKKGTPLRTLEEAQQFDEYAGVIADDAILIDVDDYEESEKLLRIVEDKELLCRVYETSRGKHFFFKNTKIEHCATNATLACGIHADIKSGKVASYAVLKRNGKERQIIYDILDGEQYQELPAFLLPIKKAPDFSELEEGDGRNQKLYNYILRLQTDGLEKSEIRETLQIINDYIFSEPLPESELETLSRDEAFQKESFFSGQKFLFDRFAQFLRSEYHIVKIDGQLHIYDEGIYKGGYKPIESKMIQHLPGLNKAKRGEVISYLELICKHAEMSGAENIAFRNGIYNIETGELLPFSPDIVILNKIDWNYNPDAYNADIEKMFDRLACGDDAIKALLCEAIGYCFYRRNELRKAFILTGEKQNGKSTYLKLISFLLGAENITALDLGELGQRFKAAELFGKLANIGDDIGDDFIQNPAIFKKVVSGDVLNVERKGQDPFDLRNYAKFLFSANNIPRIKDKSGAVISRLVIIPFNARFTKDDPDFDPYIIYKLTTESAMEYLINLALAGLKRVLSRYSFTESQSVQEALQEYEENNNPILIFFKELEREEVINKSTRDLFARYGLFCSENGFNAMSNVEFSKTVRRVFEVDIKEKRVNGKKYRVFTERQNNE